jgi:hypothetical protein
LIPDDFTFHYDDLQERGVVKQRARVKHEKEVVCIAKVNAKTVNYARRNRKQGKHADSDDEDTSGSESIQDDNHKVVHQGKVDNVLFKKKK